MLYSFRLMSEEQFQAFIKVLDVDRVMQERLDSAVDLDSAVAIATEAGFAVSRAEMLNYQAQHPQGTQELSDEDLGGVAGGSIPAPGIPLAGSTGIVVPSFDPNSF
ncbi:Nif11-like leader peptide family RiPP precursor [Synechococcus sp. CCY9201]|uniref:Nif11-like leader peptide family RiPP precursor n=1 Tax=Synechococcus sp. CCY9201 TaxID=174697 RepID=UPI002B1FE4CD|nr:Nif11-like leader peptide family RiPP precursor [Synechococcus sp. CCY9201]MEA5475964.1 Nif11-like leader peptide family RiPP precursor [Synechococcus sp. CCY9201]